MIYTLPKLNYSYQALEPHIDAKTMEIHHTKHHQAYVDNLNKVLERNPGISEKPLEELMKNLGSLEIPEADKTALRNHGGGHLNHSLFWTLMDPQNKADTKLRENIEKKFGSIESFKEEFGKSALSQFGSGWAWLVKVNGSENLEIYSTPNQDSPHLNGDTPIIGMDVWEHAYYLKYQNRRAEYLQAWWQTLKLI